VLIIALLSLSAIPFSLAQQDFSISYQLLDKPGGTATYTINVMISQSLQTYYAGLDHTSSSVDDIAKFVTPDTLKPIADILRGIYNTDEDFANAVLEIVHQIPYQATTPEYYPVETMVRNLGDCGKFSFVAASIMKAGGLDVVLLYYKNETHMNIGIHLLSPPKDTRGDIYSVNDTNGETYYVAETTGLLSDWSKGWRVGECPDDLKQATSQVLTLENSEQIAPGRITASFTEKESSTLTVAVSPTISLQYGNLTIKGQINPTVQNENVTVFLSDNGNPWTILGTTLTSSSGQFVYYWKSDTVGFCTVRVSWEGNSQYGSAMSDAQTITLLPSFMVPLVVIVLIATSVGAIVFLMTKSAKQGSIQIYEPQPSTS
jgi:hypothetical protein